MYTTTIPIQDCLTLAKFGSSVDSEFTVMTAYHQPHYPPACPRICKVDSKKNSYIMNLFNLAPRTVIVCIVEDRCIVFHCILVGNSTLTYYQPVLSAGD